ncbi:efflux RND transporter periplasmic adaptor subunit [Wenzhouxiangella sp. AB-CW3]|uniref:efflux RND transporter periplasmic adaptor subunit n=1 Tax=Wenzhouxiangella sp. AB-CW3 TaxID=2771012 RepID=UPI00168BB80A|nr:efflux RND transporter periplasmic adaptor subunit [Wenzhouxiangella sp. AB-CW3]QOC21759.1 efflux RND transporter periplasmic adaptor subunit [Wenzhouxiangella sp. AB-CW3]
MKKVLKFVLPPVLILLSIVVVVMMAMNRPTPPEREATSAAMLVDVIEARESDGHFMISAQGTARPRTETTIVNEVSGRVVEVSERFAAGGFFRADEVLARIDPSDYEAALVQARAELASAEAQLADERARSEQARKDWERMHGDARQPSDLVLRLPQLAGAEAAVKAAEASVMRAERNLERTRISLPYEGLVRARDIDLGQFVSSGTTLGRAFAVDVAEIRLPLSDQDLAFLDLPGPGHADSYFTPVTLSGTVGGQRGLWSGRVVRTEGVIDEGTRLSYAVVEIEDPYGLLGQIRAVPLQMGTFVRAEIRGRSSDGLIELPRSALREGDTLFLADESDRLDVRPVQVVRRTPHRVYLHNNIRPGERVVTTAIPAPLPGMSLQPREATDEQPELRLLPPELADAREDES